MVNVGKGALVVGFAAEGQKFSSLSAPCRRVARRRPLAPLHGRAQYGSAYTAIAPANL